MAVLNHQLAETAKLSGVIKPEHFATFTDRGYQGLYNGETENMIHARKGLQEGEYILDFMGSDELIANAFRASLYCANVRAFLRMMHGELLLVTVLVLPLLPCSARMASLSKTFLNFLVMRVQKWSERTLEPINFALAGT